MRLAWAGRVTGAVVLLLEKTRPFSPSSVKNGAVSAVTMSLPTVSQVMMITLVGAVDESCTSGVPHETVSNQRLRKTIRFNDMKCLIGPNIQDSYIEGTKFYGNV